jgi:cyclophilin family peptidyl-prolyl cis-trans isomerase
MFRVLFEAIARLPVCTKPQRESRGRVGSPRLRKRSHQVAFEPLEAKQLLAVTAVGGIANQSFAADALDPVTVGLGGVFADTEITGTVVRFDHNAPTDVPLYVELFDKPGPGRSRTTPLTTSNFLAYVADDAYDGTFIHRSVTDFVVQGGGFQAPEVPANEIGSDPQVVPQRPTVANEPGNSNVRGTIAMAKLGGNPDSATNQWYFNLSDNTFLDTDNGGYTVFGRVLGSGMAAIDVMGSALTFDASTYYANQAFSDLPLWNVSQDNIVRRDDFVRIEAVDVLQTGPMSFSATTNNALVSAAIVNGQLQLTPRAGASGVTVVTVQATSLFDPTDTASQSFFVTTNGSGSRFAPPTIDLNGDGIFDVIWRDESIGANMGWIYDAAGNVAQSRLLGLSLDYSISATGDFNGDSVTDFIWQQASTGIQLMWLMNADGSLQAANGLVGNPWRLDGTGDFNGDGKTDVIWRNSGGGENVMWLMDGMQLVGQSLVNADAGWELVSTSGQFDANADGKTDLIWRNVASGTNVLWRMDGTTLLSGQNLGGDLDYAITGAADFDGDGDGDLLWRQQSTGSILQWLLNDGAFSSSRFMGQAGTWRVESTPDTNGDGFADILFRDSASGSTTLWLLNAGAVGGIRTLSGPTSWNFLGNPGRQAS